jgi:hypothetical protein
MASHIERRKFLATLGGAAAAWPIAARAQQRERIRRIGVLTAFASDDPAQQSRLLAFAQALAQSGWTEGRNVRIDIRWGAGDPERIRRYAAELVALAPDVILAVGSPSTGPLLQATGLSPAWSQMSTRKAKWVLVFMGKSDSTHPRPSLLYPWFCVPSEAARTINLRSSRSNHLATVRNSYANSSKAALVSSSLVL